MWIAGIIENIVLLNGGTGLLIIFQELDLKTHILQTSKLYIAAMSQVRAGRACGQQAGNYG